MFDETMLKMFGAGLGGNVLLLLTGFNAENYETVFRIVCQGLITFGTLMLMYKQYKKRDK